MIILENNLGNGDVWIIHKTKEIITIFQVSAVGFEFEIVYRISCVYMIKMHLIWVKSVWISRNYANMMKYENASFSQVLERAKYNFICCTSFPHTQKLYHFAISRKPNGWSFVLSLCPPVQDRGTLLKYIFYLNKFSPSPSNHHKFPFESVKQLAT